MSKPKLRPLDFRPVVYQDETMWLLRDPLRLSDRQLILPAPLAQLLSLCDGEHTAPQIHRGLCLALGAHVPYAVVADAIAQLDQLYLLDNDRTQQAVAQARAVYRAQPYRPPALAGVSYPADSAELTSLFLSYANGQALNNLPAWHGRGLISPHIDYQRGGPVYAQVWQRAAAAVQEADLILMFGTDHNGGPASLTLTQLPYATPFGVIPTDPALLAHLAEVVGPDAFSLELNHREEHAIELSATWLHHIRGHNPCPMLPILCGSFQHFTDGGHPRQDQTLTAFVEALQEATAGRKVLAVASVDLAHVGPAFDSDYLMDEARRATLSESDARLRRAIGRGDAESFYRLIAAGHNSQNVCGFSSIYLLLRYLGETHGTEIAYAHCPADPENTSVVSICGMLLD